MQVIFFEKISKKNEKKLKDPPKKIKKKSIKIFNERIQKNGTNRKRRTHIFRVV